MNIPNVRIHIRIQIRNNSKYWNLYAIKNGGIYNGNNIRDNIRRQYIVRSFLFISKATKVSCMETFPLGKEKCTVLIV